MIRRLLVLLIAAFVGWCWLRRRRAAAPSSRRAASPVRAGATMVRDRICNTFLPASSAVALGNGADTLFFCSTACRDKHLRSAR